MFALLKNYYIEHALKLEYGDNIYIALHRTAGVVSRPHSEDEGPHLHVCCKKQKEKKLQKKSHT